MQDVCSWFAVYIIVFIIFVIIIIIMYHTILTALLDWSRAPE